MYGKLLENGVMKPAPLSLRLSDSEYILNPSDEVLLEHGYLPVEETPIPPGIYDDKHWEFRWEQVDGVIYKRWKLVENPPREPSERERIDNLEKAFSLLLSGSTEAVE